MMKYSVKQLALFVLMVSLGLGVFASFMRIRALEDQKAELQDALGYGYDSRGVDRYVVTHIGHIDPHYGTTISTNHLLRVENFRRYVLELTFYDGTTKESKSETLDLNEPVVAITHFRNSEMHYFAIEPSFPNRQATSVEFDNFTHEEWSYTPLEGGDEISDWCIMSYYFCEPDAVELPNHWETGAADRTLDETIEICNKYKIQSLSLRILPRGED